jgi:hypothetical protein
MDVTKLEKLAEELETLAHTTKVIVDGTPKIDISTQEMTVQWKNLRRWAATIREAIQ